MNLAGKPRGGKPFTKGDPRINRKGRPRGSRDRMSEALVDAFYADWMENGDAAIQKVRESDISTYVRIAVAMMPKEVKQEVEVRDSSEYATEIEWDIITGGKSS